MSTDYEYAQDVLAAEAVDLLELLTRVEHRARNRANPHARRDYADVEVAARRAREKLQKLQALRDRLLDFLDDGPDQEAAPS
jgi:hypothetical protein